MTDTKYDEDEQQRSSCECDDSDNNKKQCSTKEALPEEDERLNDGQTSNHYCQLLWKACTSPTRGRVISGDRLLCQQLSDTLCELDREKENLRLAASAGNALLEQLGSLQVEHSLLREKLEAREAELHIAELDNARLKNMCTTMEIELRHYDKLWTELQQYQSIPNDGTPPNLLAIQHMCMPSGPISPRSPQSNACRRCDHMTMELRIVLQENDELKRRCVNLEVQHERLDNGWTELQTLNKKYEEDLQKVEMNYAKSLTDIEYMTQQLKMFKDEQCELISTRDNMRAMNNQLQTENETLRYTMSKSNQSLKILEAERHTIVLQQQVLENRATSLVHEKSQLVHALSQCHAQLEAEQATKLHMEILERQTMDLELLLEEANKQLQHVRRCDGLPSVPTTAAEIAERNQVDEGCKSIKVEQNERIRCQTSRRIPFRSMYEVGTSEGNSPQRNRRLCEIDDDRQKPLEYESHGVDGDLMSLTNPLYVGLSLVACVTAVRYFYKR